MGGSHGDNTTLSLLQRLAPIFFYIKCILSTVVCLCWSTVATRRCKMGAYMEEEQLPVDIKDSFEANENKTNYHFHGIIHFLKHTCALFLPNRYH